MNKSSWFYVLSILVALSIAFIELYAVKTANVLFVEEAILINDSAIKRVDYLTAVTMMEEEKNQPMKAVDYQLIVDRLTEEELLFQYGLAQGYIYQPAISQVIVSNMLETISIQHTSEEYSDEKLYQIYLKKLITNQDIESLPEAMQFEQVKIDLANALREIERSKAVSEYLNWLRKRADINIDASIELHGVGANNE